MVRGGLHGSVNDNCTIFKRDILASVAPFVRSLFRIVHLIEPIRATGEPAAVEDHAHGEIRVVNVVVEGYAPHHN